tara:strand:+ start:147 stop:596 length:450 start_codon:yes stop_codon:yes gene_type:complete
MKFIVKFLILFFVCESQCAATSTSFEQNLIFNNNNQSFNSNANKSIGNFNTLAISGLIGIIGENLYQAGFMSPFGLIPDNIKNLSPNVFNDKSKPKMSNINPTCYDSYLNERHMNYEFENTFFEIINKCNLIIEENNFKSIDNLLSRYF